MTKANQEKTIKRESFVFYASFYNALSLMPEKARLNLYSAIMEYAFTGKKIPLSPEEQSIMYLIYPQLDANNRRFENGSRGGRPKKGLKKSNEKPETNGFLFSKPNVNDNENVNDNDNENVNLISKEVSIADKTYEQLIDDNIKADFFGEPVKRAIIEFIKHLNLNGVKIINSRLESICIELGIRFPDDRTRIECIHRAINGGRMALDFEKA